MPGSFAALLAVGHLQGGGLGAAYGSFFVASLIWCALTLPVRRIQFHRAFCAIPARADYFRDDGDARDHPNLERGAAELDWQLPSSPGFPVVNILAGAIAVAVLIAVMLWGGARLRRGAILAGLAAGTACYALFRPISFAAVASAPCPRDAALVSIWIRCSSRSVIVFLLVLIPPGMGSMAMYQMVADWGRRKAAGGANGAGSFRHGDGICPWRRSLAD